MSDRKYSSEGYIMNFTWQGFKGSKSKLKADDGAVIPFFVIEPEDNSKESCVLLLHGITGSKDDWRVIDGFAKLGNLTLSLLKEGYAVAAPDARLHGELQKRQYPGFMKYFEDVTAGWESFYPETRSDIEKILQLLTSVKHYTFNKITIVGFSMGGFFTYDLIGTSKCTALHSAVVLANAMIPQDDMAGNPLLSAKKIGKPVLMIVGDNDENFPVENASKIFEEIPCTEKKLNVYKCGHDLNEEYIDEVLDWIKSHDV